jgi:hypothetical protein
MSFNLQIGKHVYHDSGDVCTCHVSRGRGARGRDHSLRLIKSFQVVGRCVPQAGDPGAARCAGASVCDLFRISR